MLLEIKQYLNGDGDEFPQKLAQLPSDEAYNLWKNQIFKLRKLTQQQVQLIYNLFEQYYINNTQIQSNEQLTEYLSLCRQCSNFTEGKFINWKKFYLKLLQQKNQFILDKLVILGEYDLLKSDDASLLSPIYLKKFLKYVLFHKIEDWRNYESLLIQEQQIILKAALSAKMQQNTEPILFEISKAGANHKEMFDSIVMSWSNKNFIQNASFKTQLYCSNLIVLYLKDGFNNDLIHDGIQKRLNAQASIPRKCGMLVWKQFVKSLNIESNYKIEEFEEEEINELYKEQPPQQVTEQIIEPSNDFQDFESVNMVPETSLVKNLYDCVLALRSEDQQRIDAALKHLPYLVRHGLDIHVHGETLCDILILGRDWKSDQEVLRIQGLVALSIMRPQIADHLIEKYFSEELSIMQRIYILKIIRESVIELSSNPKKYPLEKYDKFEQNQNSTFYFKQISTSYTTPKEKKRSEPISKRWGHTKRAHEGLQIVEPYVNRFHQLTDHFYFPLLVFSQTKHKLLLVREPLLMLNFLEVLLNMMDCGQNALHKSNIISEALDFLSIFEKNKNVEIILMKLRIVLKIVILLKGEYDDRVAKILVNLKYDDDRIKQLYELILQYI